MSTPSKPRKCGNWLKTFLQWTLPNSEAPESYLIWSGLFCISAVMKRRVRWDKRFVKKWDIFPTSYIVFVAPPGVAKKSTTAGWSEKLLMKFSKAVNPTHQGYVNLGPTSGSDVKMIEAMSATLDGSMTIIAGEFGNIVKTRTAETYDFFTKMFDNDPHYIHDTIGGGKTTVLDPSFNILGCTTPDWMAGNSGYIQGGGFAARTIFVFEQTARQRKLFDQEFFEENGEIKMRDIGPSPMLMEQMENDLVADLRIISEVTGEAKPESIKLAKRMSDWYLSYVDEPIERGTETFAQRKHVHALRTAMLLSLCERDDLIISENHFDAALELIGYVESRLSRGFSTVGRNPYSGVYHQVLDFIINNSPVKRSDVVTYFFRDFDRVEELYSIFEVLKVTGKVEEVNAGRLDAVLRKASK